MTTLVLRLTRDRVLDGVKYPAGFALGELALADGIRPERLRLCLSNNACAFEEEPAAAAPVAVDQPGVDSTPVGAVGEAVPPAEPSRRRRNGPSEA